MNAAIGWALAALAVALGYVQWGWRGAVLGVTLTVFWLLLQFNRALRAMRQAAQAPVGRIDSAVMLHSKLKTGMRLVEILPLTRSLGQRVSDSPEQWRWVDAGDDAVLVTLRDGRVSDWALQRAGTARESDVASA